MCSLLIPGFYTFSGPDLCNLQVFGTDTSRPFKADCIQSCRDDVSLPRLLAASGNQVWDLVKARKLSVRLVGLPDLCCAWKEPMNSKVLKRLGTCEDWLTGWLVLGSMPAASPQAVPTGSSQTIKITLYIGRELKKSCRSSFLKGITEFR